MDCPITNKKRTLDSIYYLANCTPRHFPSIWTKAISVCNTSVLPTDRLVVSHEYFRGVDTLYGLYSTLKDMFLFTLSNQDRMQTYAGNFVNPMVIHYIDAYVLCILERLLVL